MDSGVSTQEVDMSDYETLGCLHEMFVTQARRSPAAVAVVDHAGRQLTFSELDHSSDVLALKLRHMGIGRAKLVGILMERSVEYVIAYIGILKAGGGYLPLETSYPPSQLQSVLEDARPVAVCSKARFMDLLPHEDPTVILLDGDWLQGLAHLPLPLPTDDVPSYLDDLAYTVYSSGTTGKPKGIQCPHRGAVFSYHWRHLAYPYQPDDREACNVFFVWEMLRPLLKGIPMYVIPDDVIYNPPELINFLQRNAITRMLFTPSLLQTVLNFKGIDLKGSFKTMRQVWLCGEVVTTALQRQVAELLPWVQLLNLYSISEAHDIAVADLTGPPQGGSKFCSVGRLLPGVHVIIMDDEMRPQPIGAPGEVYIGGPTLAIGYLNRPDLTAQKFLPRPPNVPASVGPRLYRTGDWGYLLSNDELEICGRCDSMVKIRGYSIEVQAVESALMELPMVKAGCVLEHGEEGSDKFLVAYVVPQGKTSSKEVRDALKKRLAFYMIPSKFMFLDSLPILESSGKLDKKMLQKIKIKGDNNFDEQELPTTEMERRLVDIWCRVLNVERVDVQESFFDLGGHSLLGARLLSEINEELAADLTITDLFSHLTISAMARLLEDPSRRGSVADRLDLKAEVYRHDQENSILEIKLRAFWRSFQTPFNKSLRNKILLTGATGFVGSSILRELLLSTKAMVFCLVRESPNSTPFDRIRKTFHKYGLLKADGDSCKIEECLEQQVIPVIGDVSLQNLGLKDDEYAYLSYEVDSIIHAAATVNLVFPYAALYGSNVVGTQNIILLAMENKIKHVHYISTDAVFPSGLRSCGEDVDMLAHMEKLSGGYGQTKWVSEQLLLHARTKGLPVAIYRCGNVAGSREHPCWNEVDFTLLMIDGCLLTMMAPDISWQIELTPVDFVSKVVVALSHDVAHSIGKIFHLVNMNTMDCKCLWELMKKRGYPVRVVTYSCWYENVKAAAASGKARKLNSLLHLLNSLVRGPEYFANLSTFKQDNLQAFLESRGWKYPSVDEELLSKYLIHLAILGLIPKPDTKYTASAGSLQGKVVLVTGASSGIGAAIAQLLAMNGAKVALAARRVDRLNELQMTIESEGGKALTVEMDVTKPDQVREAVKRVESSLGTIDVLVNNAGVMYLTLMKNVRLDEWQHMVDVNVSGVLNCLAATLAGMVRCRSGHVVNISSDAGRKAFPGLAVYTGTKYFMEGMSRSLRQEVSGSGVRVTCIQPGDATTEIDQYSKDKEAAATYGYELKRALDAKDVAEAVLYAITQPAHCAINEVLVEPQEMPI